MSSQPLVSILAICYNHSPFAVETLNSIIQQSYPNIQLIIIDDCSTDNSVEIIQQWIDKNKIDCVFIPHKINQGVCKTLNEGLSFVKGKYFQGISCDDIMLKEKIAKQVEIMESNPNLAFIHSNGNTINEKTEIIEELNQAVVRKDGITKDFFGELLIFNAVLAPSVLVRTSMLPPPPVYDESLFFEDWDLWLKLSLKHDVYYTNEPLVQYRKLSNSMMRSTETRRKIEIDSIKVLERYKGLSDKYDRTIENSIFKIRERHDLYDYSLFALLTGKTSLRKFKEKLRIRTRIKNFFNKQ